MEGAVEAHPDGVIRVREKADDFLEIPVPDPGLYRAFQRRSCDVDVVSVVIVDQGGVREHLWIDLVIPAQRSRTVAPG